MSAPTLLGHVGAVAGANVNIRQFEGVASGIAIIGGRSYRVGQVGSFVRIPQGYHDLYGIISNVGASATPETVIDVSARGDRWIKVQLVGEIIESTFERGISQYPAINDEAHLVTEADLAKIYGVSDKGQIKIGRLAGAESIPVRVDLDKLVSRHSAVLGSTGSGKSTTVASLLRSISGGDGSVFPNARILLIDIHGEYGKALSTVARTFRVNPLEGEHPLLVPYWAMSLDELLSFLLGRIDEKALTAIQDRILQAKSKLAQNVHFDGLDSNSLMASSPLPFSLSKPWLDLIDPEVKTWTDPQRTVSARIKEGDADKLIPPKYPPAGPGNTPPFLNNAGVLSIRRQLDQLKSRLLDKQYSFMLRPGDWEPDADGACKRDLDGLLDDWLGHDRADHDPGSVRRSQQRARPTHRRHPEHSI